jgi:MFS family permease
MPDPTPAPAAPSPTRRWALAGLSLSMLSSSLGISIANVGLPALAQAFGASFPAVQWVVLAYLLAVTALVVGIGRLADQVGRRRLLLVGLALFTAASALCGAAPTLGLLVAARALQGLAAAALMALTLAFVGTAVPRSQAGRASGLLGAMSAVGTALGPALGGLLLSGFGWRALFLAEVPPGILALALVRRHLPADLAPSDGARAGPDVSGTLLLALVLAAYALAMTWARGRPGATTAALLLAAALGAGLLFQVERRAASPLIPLALLRDPALGAALAANALVSTVMMATLVVGPFHLARALGLDAAQVGLALSVGPVVAALGGVPAGHLVDRFGPFRMTATGLACMAAGASLLAMLPATLGVAGYVAPLVAVTAGYALFQAANNTSVMADVDAARRGLVSGMLTLSRNLGLVTGASAMGAVFAVAAGAADLAVAPPAAVAAGTRATFAVAALLVALALAFVRAGRVVASRLRPDPSGS